MQIDDRVKRNTTERGYQGEGLIVEIDSVRNRAKVQWETNKTWYNMERLVVIRTEQDISGVILSQSVQSLKN